MGKEKFTTPGKDRKGEINKSWIQKIENERRNKYNV